MGKRPNTSFGSKLLRSKNRKTLVRGDWVSSNVRYGRYLAQEIGMQRREFSGGFNIIALNREIVTLSSSKRFGALLMWHLSVIYNILLL